MTSADKSAGRRMLALFVLITAMRASAAENIEVRTHADTGILQPEGKLWGQLPFYNVPVELSPQKPAAVKKVPVTRGAMVFGSVSVGDLDSQSMLVALDREIDGADAESDRRLYIDSNQNGDLTDDGDGTWFQFVARGPSFKASTAGRTVTVRYASGECEQHSLYFVYAVPRADGDPQLSYRRGGARTGVIGTDQKNIPFVLIENNGRAVYNDSDAEMPLWIMLDLNADGAFATEERYDARRSMIIGDTVYELRASASGSKLAFVPTTRAPQIPSAPRATSTRARPDAARPPLLAVGSAAPDFVVEKAGGGTMKLSDLRGQVVVLDFWATWCGPCKASMPSLEELHDKAKAQGVTVFGVCVWDTREKFDAWMKEPPVKTTYLKAFDPAGVNRENGNAESIAKKFYKVSGIPTFYVIDRDGKIAAAFVGNSATSKQGLKATLAKLGMSL